MTTLAMEAKYGFARTSKIGVEAQIRGFLEECVRAHGGVERFVDTQKGSGKLAGAAGLFPDRKITALVVRKVNDMALVEDSAGVVADDSAVAFVHAVGTNELLGWKEVDRASRGIEPVDFDVDCETIDIGKAPVDEAVSLDCKFGTDASDTGVRWSNRVPVWKVHRVVADSNGAATVEDNGSVVGGDGGNSGSFVRYESREKGEMFGTVARGNRVEVLD